MLNLMKMFISSVVDWKYLFWAGLLQKIKLASLSWNVVLRLIQKGIIQR